MVYPALIGSLSVEDRSEEWPALEAVDLTKFQTVSFAVRLTFEMLACQGCWVVKEVGS